MTDYAALWLEIRPILGPLIQAFVVLGVGVWTILFQRRQARTAELKLFSELHDKRYKALSSFTRGIIEAVLAKLDEDDNQPPRNANDKQAWFRGQSGKLEELTWLFGGDVIFHLYQMHERMEEIIDAIERLRHKLKDDNPVDLVNIVNSSKEALYVAYGQVNDAARNYLYVGDIRMQAPSMPLFTMDELNSNARPRRFR